MFMSSLDCYFPIGTSILVNLSAKLTLFLETTKFWEKKMHVHTHFSLYFPLNAIFFAKKVHKITFMVELIHF